MYKFSDSLALASNVFPGKRNSLDSLAKRFNIDLSSRSLHGALLDSKILAQVYLKLVDKQKELINKKGHSEVSVKFDALNRDSIPRRPIDPELSSKLRVVSIDEQSAIEHRSMMSRIEESSGMSDLVF